MWMFLGFGAFVLGVGVLLGSYVVITTRRGDGRFRAALAQRPDLRMKGMRVRTVAGAQLMSRESEYELTRTNAAAIRVRPSYLPTLPDPTQSHGDYPPGLSPDLGAQNLLDGWIDDVRWPTRLEVIRGTPREVWVQRYVNRLPELTPQSSPAEDVFMRGDAPCPEGALAAILAFVEPGTMLCLDPSGVWFQSRRGPAGQLLDETDLPAIDAAFTRATALRAALLEPR